jgi:cysteinyl-tRNA synthetase
MCGPTVYDSAHLGHAWYVPAIVIEEIVYKNTLLKYNTGR